MAVKRIGAGLIIVGTFGIALSLLIAFLLRAQADGQSIQILGIEISVIVILIGLWLVLSQASEEVQFEKQVQKFVNHILNLPMIIWVLLAFLLVYFRYFIFPLFLNSGLVMDYLTGYLENINPIGNDLIVMLDQIKGWVATGQSPYLVQFYPPLTYLIFTPLLLIKDYLALYRFFTAFSFINYSLLTLWLPFKMIDKRNASLAFLLFVTGLFSYGFQLELERGQYNVFAFLLCMSSIYTFHYHPKYRLIAYFLFSISIQLKLYPAIFIFMFVDDWRDWKNTIRRFIGIGIFNLMLFFVMGPQIFLDFIRSVTAQIVNPSWKGVTNHSISSFVGSVKYDGLGLVNMETLRVIRHNSEWLEAFLFVIFIILFVSNLVIFYIRKEPGLDPYLLLACTIGAIILPISYDYTLSILVTPMLLFLNGMSEMTKAWHKLLSILLTLAISIAYFSTLVPYKYRPFYLDNIFPSLFLILIVVTILNFMRYKNSKVGLIENELAT